MPNLTIPLGIDSLEIISQAINTQGNIIIDVESMKSNTVCHKCGKLINKRHGFGEIIQVCHLPILDTLVYLRIRVVCYECVEYDNHPTTLEQYD